MKKVFVSFLIALLLPAISFAAVAFDNKLDVIGVSTAVNTQSFTTSGTNRYLLVCAYNGLGNTSAAILSATYAGASMTLVNNQDDLDGNHMALFSLSNPTSGANNIAVTFASAEGSASHYILASSYTGVLQNSTAEAKNTAWANGANPTVSVTTLTNNAWVAGCLRGDSATTAGTNTIFRTTSGGVLSMNDTNSAQTPAGSHALNATMVSNRWQWMAVSLAPAAAAYVPNTQICLSLYCFYQ